jgi:predicted nucleic acid-binding protein
MRYVDTSALVPLLLPEVRSRSIRAWFRELDLGEVAVSTWTMTEFTSALGGKVRAGVTTAEAALRANTAFQRLARISLRSIVPAQQDFLDAADLLKRFDLGLRAGDALHVAIARNHHSTLLVTLDQTLARAAERLGLACEIPA